MSTSIKLNNDTYVDATGVYDSTLGSTQRQLNARFSNLYAYTISTTTYTKVVITATSNHIAFILFAEVAGATSMNLYVGGNTFIQNITGTGSCSASSNVYTMDIGTYRAGLLLSSSPVTVSYA